MAAVLALTYKGKNIFADNDFVFAGNTVSVNG